MQIDLAGKVALVRGTEGRWSAAIAARLAASGARVVGIGQASDVGRRPEPPDILVNADPSPASVPDVVETCEAAAAAMTTGRIVNVGSVFGLVPAMGSRSVAGASAALFAQTRALALALAPRGILVNAVAVLDEDRPHTPLGRAAGPDDVAGAVLFLLAAESSYLVGEVLRVDGGWTSGYARAF